VPTKPEQLRQTVTQLHEQLASLSSVDADDRRMLGEALDDIRRALDGGSVSKAQSDSFFRRLNEAARRFEDSHPTLSGAVGGLVDAIARLGI
jgi:hypothetical protein